MKKAIGLILVVAILAAGVMYLRGVEHADQENMRDLYSVVEPLQREREALVQERDKLEIAYALEMRDIGTVELLFREMDRRIFTEVYPLMRDRGITGVIGLSHEEYPGTTGKLTIEQYNRLLMDGWGSCLLYDRKPKDFESWFASLSRTLEHDKLPMPTAIFMADGCYESEMEEQLINAGIRTVILNTEDGHSATVSPVENRELWYTGAMPWNYTGVSRDTEILARTNGANLVFTISFRNLWDAFDKTAFTAVLDTWAALQPEDDILQEMIEATPTPAVKDPTLQETPEDQLAKPQLKFVNFEQARSAHESAEAKNAELTRELTARQAEIDEKIAKLDAEIREQYDRWSESQQQLNVPFGA